MRSTLVWSLVLAAFLVFTGWAFVRPDFLALAADTLRNPVSLQVSIDLCITMAILLGFIWKDARQRGINPLPYCLLSVVLGSIGAMIYLVRRGIPRGAGAGRG